MIADHETEALIPAHLKVAIERNFPLFVPTLLSLLDPDYNMTWALISAAEIGRTEIVIVFLRITRTFDEQTLLSALKYAKRRNDEAMVSALRDYLARLHKQQVIEHMRDRLMWD